MGFILLGLVHCTDASSPPPSVGPNQPDLPNIVLIIIDNLRADRLGAYGFDGPISPELDAYARAGVRFARVVAQTTWTRPSIGSMLTSRYPRTLGLYREKEEVLDDRFATLAEVLQGNGYWAVGATANPNINSYFNFHQGFDEYIDSDVVFSFMDREASPQVLGKTSKLPAARSLFDRLEETVRLHKGRRPAYLQVNLMEVHEYYRPPMEGEPYDALAAVESRAPYLNYAKAVRRVSLETDRFIRRLRALPGWENTLFVIVSDHGDSLGGPPVRAIFPNPSPSESVRSE
jgi:arylsulfatase A-like enzyme